MRALVAMATLFGGCSRDAHGCQREAQRVHPGMDREEMRRREHFAESCMQGLGYSRQRRMVAW